MRQNKTDWNNFNLLLEAHWYFPVTSNGTKMLRILHHMTNWHLTGYHWWMKKKWPVVIKFLLCFHHTRLHGMIILQTIQKEPKTITWSDPKKFLFGWQLSLRTTWPLKHVSPLTQLGTWGKLTSDNSAPKTSPHRRQLSTNWILVLIVFYLHK